MKEKKLTVNSYDESVSRNLFTEGLLKFDVEQTSLTIIPIFTDLIANTESRTLPIEIRSIESKSGVITLLSQNSPIMAVWFHSTQNRLI